MITTLTFLKAQERFDNMLPPDPDGRADAVETIADEIDIEDDNFRDVMFAALCDEGATIEEYIDEILDLRLLLSRASRAILVPYQMRSADDHQAIRSLSIEANKSKAWLQQVVNVEAEKRLDYRIEQSKIDADDSRIE